MHIKFDSLKGLREVVEYQKAMTVVKGIMFDLYNESNKFSEWTTLVDFPVEKNFNNFEISFVENEDALIYFLITVDMKADELKVEVKHVYDEYGNFPFFNKARIITGNVFKPTETGYARYIYALHKLIENGVYKVKGATAKEATAKESTKGVTE